MSVGEDEECEYRIRIGEDVKYITVQPGVFNHETLSFPPDLLEAISHLLPTHKNWSSLDINLNELAVTTSSKPLAGVSENLIWHRQKIEVTTLPITTRHTPRTREVSYAGGTAISKIARFEWEIPYVEKETEVYATLHKLGEDGLAPRFLGHLTENGRVMGFLIEKLAGRHAGIEDLEGCLEVVKTFHRTGMVHGDLCKYNFLVEEGGIAKLIDFENASSMDCVEDEEDEINGLAEQLAEDDGRGAPYGLSSNE